MMGCPSCAEPLPDGARFCPSCGLSLVPVALDERRVVTVVFADLVGFTALAEHRDPEQVKRFVDSAFERLVSDVELFGGRVDKVLGDAVIALFGAPVAHEDDAERAVRTAMRFHETLRAFVDERTDDSPAVRLRVGVNTGEVLVGTVAGSEYTAMGDVVNLASRLQTMASPGEVLVGDATRNLCSDSIRFEPLEPIQLRGREQVEQVWRAVGIDAVPRTRRRGGDTPFVGRAIERSLLDSVLGLVTRGRGAVVSVTGEAGVGKSRLVDEVLCAARDRDDVAVIEGVCPPYGESNVWAPIAAGIAARYGIERDQATDEVRTILLHRAADVVGIDPTTTRGSQEVEALLHLMGYPSDLDRLDPAGARDVLFATVVGGIQRRAARGPVVIWIDDLQWAHALLIDLLGMIVRSATDLPVLVVTACRPMEDLEWPVVADRSLSFQLPMHPLDEVESAELINELTGGRADAELVERLYERSGGNPLFLTELSRLAVDGPAIDDAELPGTLRALIASRLDQLGLDERAVIDNAAILGAEGKVYALEEFANAMAQRWDPDHLGVLHARGLVEVDGEWWRFRSDVVREVAYQTLTKESRAQRHAGVAQVMADRTGGPIEELAHHAATAAELVLELGRVRGVSAEIRPWAIELLGRAARKSYDVGGFRRGVSLTERALSLLGHDADEEGGGRPGEVRRGLLLLRIEGLVELRRSTEARDDLEVVIRGAATAGDRTAEGEAHRLLGSVEQLDGDLVTAREHLGRAVEIFRELDDLPQLALALRVRGFAEVFGGSLQDAEWYLGEADALYERLDDDRGRAWVAQHRSWISFLSGDHAEAEERLVDAIATFDRLGDHSGTSWTRGLLAFVLYFQRRFDEADALAADVFEEARQWGDEWGASMMLTLTANLRLWTGQFAEAIQAGERALAGFRRIGDHFGILQSMAPVNRARVALGRSNDAERGIEELLAVSASFGGLAFPSLAASGVAMHLGDGERTVSLASSTIERMAETGSSLAEARVQLAAGHLQCGDPDAALAALLEVEVADSPFASAVRALVYVALDDPARAIEDADVAWAAHNASYFDTALAAVAGAAAAANAASDDLDERLDRLRSTAARNGDVVLGALMRAVLERLGDDVDGSDPLPLGWSRLVDLLVGPVPEAVA